MISRLILVQTNQRTAQAVRYGFHRVGCAVEITDSGGVGDAYAARGADLVIVHSSRATAKATLVRDVRRNLPEDAPILYFGNGLPRREALEAGATELLTTPAFLRDVVAIGQIIAGPRTKRGGFSGELHEHFGLFYMVRALAALRYTGVLMLTRGLRRGELRFVRGEVTSAQAGTLHALAAFHQLLLWVDSRFELRYEPLVPRNQIPLNRSEILEDGARFLNEIRNVAPHLSPSIVHVRTAPDSTTPRQIPPAIASVLQLFDGHRTMADIVEDSQFRVFDTLRIAQSLFEVGALRGLAPKRRPYTHTNLDKWLVGVELDYDVKTDTNRAGDKQFRIQKWEEILATGLNAEMIAVSPVVPAEVAVGEIDVPAVALRSVKRGPDKTERVPAPEFPEYADTEAVPAVDAEVTEDGFNIDEEEFFQAGARLVQDHPDASVSFDDLDRGFKPKTFWQQLIARPSTAFAEDSGEHASDVDPSDDEDS